METKTYVVKLVIEVDEAMNYDSPDTWDWGSMIDELVHEVKAEEVSDYGLSD